MSKRTRIMLKITGTIFRAEDNTLNATAINKIIAQLKKLSSTYQFGLVIGGGNFFRGSQQGKQLGLSDSAGHQIGMLATMMNGLIIKDLMRQHDLSAKLFSAIECAQVGSAISHSAIQSALEKHQVLIFAGGTGNPFFTTDTNAVLRALQIGAKEIWKGTDVDGIYTADPRQKPDARRLDKLTYQEALNQKLKIMDPPAFALAEQYHEIVKVFNIFADNALLKVSSEPDFASTIYAQ